MSEENLKIWNELKSVPSAAKKKIGAGRLKGMTDIKPQWRLQMMTEQFGPIGIGWYYTPVKRWTEEYGGEISAHVELNVFIKDNDEWSKPINGVGGAMLLSMENVKDYEKSVAKDKYGSEYLKPFHSDEAYKMATTDALSVAMKQLGVAADVYMGLSDSKYDKPEERPKTANKPPAPKASPEQLMLMSGYMKDFTAKNDAKSVAYMSEHLSNDDLTYEQAELVIGRAKEALK